MKPFLAALVAASVLLTPGCIIVHVQGDMDEELFDDDERGFQELKTALDGCLVDPEYDLDVSASPWHTEMEWTVRYAGSGAEGHAAFTKAREAVLQRVQREGGVVTSERIEGQHLWSCSFELDGDEGEASVRLNENAHAGHDRPHAIEVAWEEDD